MVEQVKAVDYAARGTRFVERAPNPLVEDVLSVVDVCIK
jgi:hypothetical protein